MKQYQNTCYHFFSIKLTPLFLKNWHSEDFEDSVVDASIVLSLEGSKPRLGSKPPANEPFLPCDADPFVDVQPQNAAVALPVQPQISIDVQSVQLPIPAAVQLVHL